ncbi:prostaglandin reductase-3 [Aplysia californica]|uniref:Prostaglandin reductase-3 n=1 Tax=Aplysia californica TaxID=6500 RepID=A0ABM0JXM7_APLCA|nr:prostaglandin reductase-3 [Aplysia californica]
MASSRAVSSIKRIIVTKLGTNFRDVTKFETIPVPTLKSKEVLIKNRFIGINASDINFSAGRYFGVSEPPFPIGFEGIGEVVAVGPDASLTPGQNVTYLNFASFADYTVVPEETAIPVPTCDPAYMTAMVSGLTASIALEKDADLTAGKTVLVTAAAGGTGQFAVQLAKMAGTHVIGTCSSEDKVEFLKTLGCDRPINYKTEDLDKVLAEEYPSGVDVVYESVGKEIFHTSLKHLANFGRLIVIGQVSTYQGDEAKTLGDFKDGPSAAIAMSLLVKCASVRGFFLALHIPEIGAHFSRLVHLYNSGKIRMTVDKGDKSEAGPFIGLEKIPDAIDYLYTGKSVGKIVVELPE